MNTIIPNPDKFQEIKSDLLKNGAANLHFLADFDKTITKAFVDGEEIPSLISILRDGQHLTPDYAAKAHELFDKYHPIETDPDISLSDKKAAMKEWWTKHYELLIKSGLTQKEIESAVNSKKIQPREGLWELIDLLQKKNIPLVILSASGLGVDSIRMFFQKHHKLAENIFIISNEFKWDKSGKLVGVKEPIVHSMNKDETLIDDFPFYDQIKNRKNVVLLGDSPDDVEMVTGFNYKTLLKVGFLNSDIEKKMPVYQKNYDVIIPDDGPMNFFVGLLKEF